MEIITIGKKNYDVSTLTEKTKGILGDLQKVENRINQITLDVSIMDVAKQKLITDLLAETKDLVEVDLPEQVAAPTPETTTDSWE